MKRLIVSILVLCVMSTALAVVLDASAPYGSRKNPVPQNEYILIQDKEYDIYLATILSAEGDKAEDVLRSFNALLSTPRKGYEYVIVGVSVSYVNDKTGDDVPYEANRYSFNVSDKNYMITNSSKLLFLLDYEYSSKLYEGAEYQGFLPFEVKIGEDFYIVYKDRVWFDITRDPL